MGSIADDTTMISTNDNPQLAPPTLRNHLNIQQTWAHKWKVNFTLNIHMPLSSCIKYLGIHWDIRLTWKNHVVKKRKQIDIQEKLIKYHYKLDSYF